MNDFIQFVTEHPVAHPQSAWQAWQHQQRHIDDLHAQIMEMQHRAEPLEQMAFEASQRKLRLVSAA